MIKFVQKDQIFFDSQTQTVFSAIDIFDNQESIQNMGYSISVLNKDVKIRFSFVNEHIYISVVVIANGSVIEVPQYKGRFLDYIVVDNTVYYLSFDIDCFYSELDKCNCSAREAISFSQYLLLKKNLIDISFDVIDDVEKELESIKNYSSNNMLLQYIKADLFEYQKIGFNWLAFMYRNNCGAILADEMGLGKTLQIISLMSYIKALQKDAHFLVCCPLSLLENWRREIEKFCTNLSVIVHHGQNRTGSFKELLKYDVVVTSYSNAQNDLGMLNMITWNLVVVDEAQNIKNPYANRSKNIKMINKCCGIAVTGTPFENHIDDVWSIVDFTNKNFLGTIGSFKNTFGDDLISASRLEPILSPLMLRRRVSEVAKDLPSRVDIPQPILMDQEEAQLYEGERTGILNMKSLSIEKIQGLRMFCTHPFVYAKNSKMGDPTQFSAKYQRLCEIVEEIIQNNEKVLIFTSYNVMNQLIVEDLYKRFAVNTYSITGATPPDMRQKIIDSFSDEQNAAVLVLNPKAAGAGLNITAANHVIHYNLEWNPATEDQASARAYRRGQNKTVFIYRLFYANTIEEIINDKIERKREMSDKLIVGNQGDIDKEDLIRALNMSPIREKKHVEDQSF